MPVKLITFDLDNTLWAVEPVILRAETQLTLHLQQSFPEHGPRLEATVLREASARLLDERPDYRNDLTSLRRHAIERVLASLGLSSSDARSEAERAFEIFHAARNQVELFPGAAEVLERLAERFVLGALTNGNADVERVGLGNAFRFQYSSESIGRRKPAPDMFVAALARAEVEAGDAVHVGDHPLEDVDAARRVGMQAVWANPLRLAWPEESTCPPTFSEFEQLERLLDGL